MQRWAGTSIAAKLYFSAFLSLVAVGMLAAASIYYSKTTETTARQLYSRGFVDVVDSTRLELLLSNHRRLVESLPSEVDRSRLRADRSEMENINERMLSLTSGAGETGDKAKIAEALPELFEAAKQVWSYAHEFAQDKSMEGVDAYANIADEIQRLITDYRRQRVQEAQQGIAFVSATAKTLVLWVLLCAFAAIVLIGPIGLTMVRKVLMRIDAIKTVMIDLAQRNTATAIPSREDHDEIGEMARAVAIFRDNAINLIARDIELAQLNRRIDIALNNMTHGLCMFDAEHRMIVCNKTYIRMYSLPEELSSPGVTLSDIQAFRSRFGNAALANPEQITASSLETQEASAYTEELMDGRLVAISQRPMQDGGWVAVHEDVTERRRAEAKIAHLARHDLLTNLPNRVLLREQLENEIRRVQSGYGFAVYCLDLDHFKTVNDTLGHPIGDELLKLVASRLTTIVSSTNFIARIGGDEFAIIQTNVTSPRQCGELATKIVSGIGEPYDIQGRHIVIGTSIGIAVAPSDGTDADVLLKNADMALYLAKGDGRGTHRFFEREMDRRLQARRLLELDLRKALANGEFEIHYQPIIYLQTGVIACFEALVRWNHPERGMIAPNEFIALAEETGLILPLGEWVLRTACLHASKWPQPVSVAVNLSATQFKGRNIVQMALSALATTGLPASRLDLEITESVLLQDEANTLAVLHQLREIGIRISIDDFGTGYSSLAYLRNFPFDKIKIDKTFVRDMIVRKDCQAIVRAVVGMARGLGIATIVEGIETKEQLEAVKLEGCDEGQGYLFSKPMPASEVVTFLAKTARSTAAA
jgi:diguanylate cyclase (GGDEF)-like protein